jgi:hypothetical protein
MLKPNLLTASRRKIVTSEIMVNQGPLGVQVSNLIFNEASEDRLLRLVLPNRN